MTQLDLPLDWPDAASADAFLVSDANRNPVRMLEHRSTWPVMAALLTGPRKSGRSLLGRIFAAHSGGVLIDDAERVGETRLFHAWNRAQTDRVPLLIVADCAPPAWRINLPDLRSRLAATPVLRIDPPDDALIAMLLTMSFDRAAVVASDEAISWTAARLERNYIAVLRAADALSDAASKKRGRRLSRDTARAALSEAGLVGSAQTIERRESE